MKRDFDLRFGFNVNYVDKECRCVVTDGKKVLFRCWSDGTNFICSEPDESLTSYELSYIRERTEAKLDYFKK